VTPQPNPTFSNPQLLGIWKFRCAVCTCCCLMMLSKKMSNQFDAESKPIPFKHQIWLLLLGNPNITVAEIQGRILHDDGTEPSQITVSALRKTYRDVLRFLVAQNVVSSSVLEHGMLKSVTANKPITRDMQCRHCHKPFTPTRADSRFCGDTCRQRHHRMKMK
jgi:hypothetical protein